jgi:putative membrane protein
MSARLTRASSAAGAMAVAIAISIAPRAAAQAPAEVARSAGVLRTADPARSADAPFLAKATEIVAADAELATLAGERARTPSVKAFATVVLDAHAALARELDAMTGIRRIGGMPRAETPSKAVAALRSQPPATFDAAFVAAMIASRTAAVALFEAESRDGRDDEVKEWAARQLPALRDHLTAARALRPRPSS